MDIHLIPGLLTQYFCDLNKPTKDATFDLQTTHISILSHTTHYPISTLKRPKQYLCIYIDMFQNSKLQTDGSSALDEVIQTLQIKTFEHRQTLYLPPFYTHRPHTTNSRITVLFPAQMKMFHISSRMVDTVRCSAWNAMG